MNALTGNTLTDPPRTVKSFVHRKGRLTRARRYALDHYWEKHGIEYHKSLLNIEHVFQRRAPLIVDIGIGTGDSTLHHALLHPENNYLAIEVYRPGIGQLLKQIELNKLTNIKIINSDVIDIFSHQLPENSITQIFIFFPDPWPKKRHHKRRLINSNLIRLIKKIMAPHGRLHIATDWQDYAQHIQVLLGNTPDFINLAGINNIACRPEWRPHTRYESRGLKLAHKVWDFCYGIR